MSVSKSLMYIINIYLSIYYIFININNFKKAYVVKFVPQVLPTHILKRISMERDNSILKLKV